MSLVDNGSYGVTLAGVDGATLTANTFTGNGGASDVRRITYVQDFNDADAANDRAIITARVIIDGVAMADTVLASGQTAWSWSVSAGNDIVIGSAGRDVIAADAGHDTVSGGAGDDLIYGNDGNDRLDGGAGNDELQGGAGADTLVYSGGVDVLAGGIGDDTGDFQGLATAVTVRLVASGFDAFVGGVGVATLSAVEHLRGTAFNDQLTGDLSANRLTGGDGNDSLDGGSGGDTLDAGGGSDRLTGGGGSDVYVTRSGDGIDVVTDFTNGADKLGMHGVSSGRGRCHGDR